MGINMKLFHEKDILWLILVIMTMILCFQFYLQYRKNKTINEYFSQEHFKSKNKKSNKKKSKKSKKSKTSKTSKTSTPTTTPPTTTLTPTPTTTTSQVSPSRTVEMGVGTNMDTLEKCDIQVDEWNKTPEEIEKQKQGLTKMQECQIRNMMKQMVKNQVMDSLSSQNPLMTGPIGPIGPPGPPGTKLIASGRIFNKSGSFNKTDRQMKNPKNVLSRSSGTSPLSSLVFMDNTSPFVSYQNWLYNDKNQIVNRYDNTCLSYKKGNSYIYMDKCDSNNPNQKWFWDNSNRLVSLNPENSKNKNSVSCLGLTQPTVNTMMSSVPDCKGNQCTNRGQKRFLTLKNCKVNSVQPDEIFSFM